MVLRPAVSPRTDHYLTPELIIEAPGARVKSAIFVQGSSLTSIRLIITARNSSLPIIPP